MMTRQINMANLSEISNKKIESSRLGNNKVITDEAMDAAEPVVQADGHARPHAAD